ncbi:MAG: septum formation initiator family protein [Clostridia bacterium]|nr:septum formation initiator family protein [Clostridia bacterium]
MAKTTKKKKQVKPVSIIVLVLCSCIVLCIGIPIIKEIIEFKQNKAEYTDAVSVRDSQVSENEALQKAVDEGDEAAIAEKYAREQGYVKPDEHVYVDITPGT